MGGPRKSCLVAPHTLKTGLRFDIILGRFSMFFRRYGMVFGRYGMIFYFSNYLDTYIQTYSFSLSYRNVFQNVLFIIVSVFRTRQWLNCRKN